MTYSVPSNTPLIPPSAAAKLPAAEGFSVRTPTFPMTSIFLLSGWCGDMAATFLNRRRGDT